MLPHPKSASIESRKVDVENHATTNSEQTPSEKDSQLREALTEKTPQLRSFFREYTSNPHFIEELVQQTLLQAIESASRGSGPSSIDNLMKWILGIARHVWYRFLSKQIRDRDLSRRQQADPPLEANIDGLEVDLSDCFNSLAENDQQQASILLLYFSDGESLGEIGIQLNLDRKTVSKRLKQALDRLRNCLGEKGWDRFPFNN